MKVASNPAVVLHPTVGCGHSEFSGYDEVALCSRVQYLGKHWDDTLAQWISVPSQNVFPRPANLSFAEAVAFHQGSAPAWGKPPPFTKLTINGSQHPLDLECSAITGGASVGYAGVYLKRKAQNAGTTLRRLFA